MISKILAILMVALLFSCSDTSIPDEIELGKEPRLLVVDFCSCIDEGETTATCLGKYRKRFKKEILELHGDDRKKYVKDVAHSLLESTCLQGQVDDSVWKEMIINLNEFADE